MLLEHLKDLDAWWTDRKAISVAGFDKARSYTPEELKNVDYNLDLCGFPQEEEEILPPKELIEKYQVEREARERVMDDLLSKILKKLGGEE